MENIEKFEQLLRAHSYQALSNEDKLWVEQFVASEAEYESLRSVSLQLEDHYSPADLATDPAQLESLKRHLAAQHQVTPSLIRTVWSVPAYAAILVLVVVCVLGWWAGSSRPPEVVFVDRILPHIDTLRVAAIPDTIVVERVVYKTVRQFLPAAKMTKTPAGEIPLTTRGVNMKEKEELDKLLVSGSF